METKLVNFHQSYFFTNNTTMINDNNKKLSVMLFHSPQLNQCILIGNEQLFGILHQIID